MAFSTLGSLVKEYDLETRAKNLLKKVVHAQNGEAKAFCIESHLEKEIEFLINEKYITKKENLTEYEITSKGAGYIAL